MNEETTYRKSVDEKLDAILNQVQKTNGRVSRLENWRWLLTGGMAVISMFVVPMAVYIFTHSLR